MLMTGLTGRENWDKETILGTGCWMLDTGYKRIENR